MTSIDLSPSPLTIADRVAAGVTMLDEVYPGWRDRIDVSALEMSDPYDCVMGQLTGSYDAWARDNEVPTDQAYHWGLYEPTRWDELPSANIYDQYDALTRAWRQYLTDGVLTDPAFHEV
jgi:hypothetical protein